MAQLVDPPLSTMAQPIEEREIEAAILVLRKIAKPDSRNRYLVL